MVEYYHVCITYANAKRTGVDYEIKLDLSMDWLNERIVSCYDKGTDIVINGKIIALADIERICISKTNRLSDTYTKEAVSIWYGRGGELYSDTPEKKWIDNIIVELGEDITDDIILGPPSRNEDAKHLSDLIPKPSEANKNVFVVHGRDIQARDDLFQFIRAIDLHPMEWSEAIKLTGKPSPHIWEILERAFGEAHAILVLLTPDDEARLRKGLRSECEVDHETQLSGQARPNVLFEAGMAMGRSEDRTVLVELGILRPFSDIAGRHTVRLDNSSQRRQELAQRLQAAGCPVNLEGTDWHTVGDFDRLE